MGGFETENGHLWSYTTIMTIILTPVNDNSKNEWHKEFCDHFGSFEK